MILRLVSLIPEAPGLIYRSILDESLNPENFTMVVFPTFGLLAIIDLFN